MANKKESISKYRKLIQENKYLQYVIYSIYKEETGKLKNGMPNIGSFNESSMEKGGGNSTAFGAGQFITETRNLIKKKYGVDAWSQNREEQEAAIIALVEDRGYLSLVRNGEFRGLASSGIWQAFENPNSVINNYSDLTGWKEELEEFREGAKYEPQTSLRKIDPEVWAKKDSLYKKDGVSPLDVATEGSVASNLAQKEVDTLMAEYEKTLPKGVDKLSERDRLRKEKLDALNKEFKLADYKIPEYEGVNWKKEARVEGLKGIFEDFGLEYDEAKNFQSNLQQLENVKGNITRKNPDAASGVKEVPVEDAYRKILEFSTNYTELLKDMTYSDYEANFAVKGEEWYESLGEAVTFGLFDAGGKDIGDIENKVQQINFQKQYKEISAKLQSEIDNADKYNYGVAKRRELLEQQRKLESINENKSSIGKSITVKGLEGVDFNNINASLKEIDDSISQQDTPERIKSDIESDAGIDTSIKGDEREKSPIISLATKGVESIEAEKQIPTRQDMSSVPLEPIKNAKLKMATDKVSGFLQDSGITGESVSNALRAGAGLLSLYDATKRDKVNQQKVSPLMLEAVNRAKEIAKVGMPYEQKMAAIKDLNNSYAGAMKNVMAISGGQRGAALASMGAVDASRVGALVDLAAKSSDMRMEGMKMFQQAAGDYSKLKLSADMNNEQLRAKLEDSRKERMLKVGSTLYEQAMEFNRNFKDESYNKELISAIQGLQEDSNNDVGEGLRQETIVGGFEDFTIPGTNFVVTKKDN